jgi:dipeptide/tripeptide permease
MAAGFEEGSMAEQRHPAGLYVLFFTELWERFSYYGMRALLQLYMLNNFKWPQGEASFYYKWYTSLVYFTPLIGGYLADRWLGNKKAVIIGATFMAIGHFLMAFENYPIFISALIFLIIGNGFFKPNMSTQVGRLYRDGDPRKDSAYTIFYMGINIGAFLSPLVCGYLGQVYSPHYGFAAAGVGMVLGLIIYLAGQRWVIEISGGPAGQMREQSAEREDPYLRELRTEEEPMQARSGPAAEAVGVTGESAEATTSRAMTVSYAMRWILALSAPLLVVLAFVLPPAGVMSIDNGIVLGMGGLTAAFMAWIAYQLRGASLDKVCAIYGLFVFVVCFWAAFEQAGNVMTVWAEYHTNRQLIGDGPALEQVVAPIEFDEQGVALPPGVSVVEAKARKDNIPLIALLSLFIAVATTLGLAYVLRRTRRSVSPATQMAIGMGIFGVALFALLYVFETSWELPAPWFQAVNPYLIALLAPMFAMMWLYLNQRGKSLSIPGKMGIGVTLMGCSFVVMIFAAHFEDGASQASWTIDQSRIQIDQQGRVCLVTSDSADATPTGVVVKKEGKDRELVPGLKVNDARQLVFVSHRGDEHPTSFGRLQIIDGQLQLRGVLTRLERDRILQSTVPRAFAEKIEELADKAEEAAKAGGEFEVNVRLGQEFSEIDFAHAELSPKKFSYNEQTRTVYAREKLGDREKKALYLAAADPKLREALNRLIIDSAKYRVLIWWLVLHYLLATLGELCLSPVGLSMVSKLAPGSFATMLMGIWLMASFFGNFVAGAFGEIWGVYAPETFFTIFVVILMAAAAVLFLLVKPLKRMMHGVL